MNIVELPPEVLVLILSRLNDQERSAVSRVSKSFLHLINGLVHKIYLMCLPSPASIIRKKLFARFTSATQIFLGGEIDDVALNEIAVSDLKIEKLVFCDVPRISNPMLPGRLLRDVKALDLMWYTKTTKGVVDFILMFRFLEELNLKDNNWTDAEIVKLAVHLRNLRKISIQINKNITDSSLEALSNCVKLEHISFKGYGTITVQGFCSFIRSQRKNLKSLDLNFMFWLLWNKDDVDVQPLAKAVSSCENLCRLSINGVFANDTFLSVIANSHIPLTSLKVTDSMNIFPTHLPCTSKGLCDALGAFQGRLTSLNLQLERREPLLDENMSKLVKSLPNLKDVIIGSYCPLNATLFSLIHNCPLLISVTLVHFDIASCVVPQEIRKNYSIQRITLELAVREPKPGMTLHTTTKITTKKMTLEASLKSLCPFANIRAF